MIGRVYRGRDTAGLLDYLYGPGRRNEHVDPHLVASWDGAPDTLEPPPLAERPGRYEVGRLARLLDAPLRLRERPPDRHVWHCALRVAETDRRLTDAEWQAVAEDVVARTGFAPRGDDGGCRWVAVRHAHDHIHLVVVLARQDGRAVREYRDFVRLREACRAAEARYGLVSTAPADRTATPATSGREADKATRLGRLASREVLRQAARAAAVETHDPAAFLARLRAMGRIQVKERRGQAGELTGYALAVTGDRDAAGEPVWYSGGKLAADLTLPKLVDRWATVVTQDQDDEQATIGNAPAGAQRLAVLADAAGAARRATSALAGGQAAGDGLAHAAADLLTAAARVTEGRRGGPRAMDAGSAAGPGRPGPATDGVAPGHAADARWPRAGCRRRASVGRRRADDGDRHPPSGPGPGRPGRGCPPGRAGPARRRCHVLRRAQGRCLAHAARAKLAARSRPSSGRERRAHGRRRAAHPNVGPAALPGRHRHSEPGERAVL